MNAAFSVGLYVGIVLGVGMMVFLDWLHDRVWS